MSDPNTNPMSPDERLIRAFVRPARIVAAVLRLLLAAGFTIALILKVYMIILTDYTCEDGVATLGNTIRCTPILLLLGYALALTAAIEFALRLLSNAPRRFLPPFTQALLAVLILYLARIETVGTTWESALFLLAAGLLLLGIMWAQRGFRVSGSDRED